MRAVVAEAGPAQAEVLGALHERNVDVVSSVEATPDYDDVFVRLVERHRRSLADAANAA